MELLSAIAGYLSPIIKEIVFGIILFFWRRIVQLLRITRRSFVFGFHSSAELMVYISGYVARDHSHKLSMGEGQLRALVSIFNLIDNYFPEHQKNRSNIEIANLRKSHTYDPNHSDENQKLIHENDMISRMLANNGNWIVVGGPINNLAARECFRSISHSNIGFDLSSTPVAITRPSPDPQIVNIPEDNEYYCWVIFLSELAQAKRKVLIIAGIDTYGTDAAALFLKSNWLTCHIKRIHKKWKHKKSHMGTAFLIKYNRYEATVKNAALFASYSIPKTSSELRS